MNSSGFEVEAKFNPEKAGILIRIPKALNFK